jgi:hypothetical protein
VGFAYKYQKHLVTFTKLTQTSPQLQMQTAFSPAFGQRVPYRFVALPESADGQVRATIREIVRLIRADCMSPEVQQDAKDYLAAGQGNPISGVWRMRERMNFQQDEKTAADTDIQDARKDSLVEVLIRPVDQSRLIRLREVGIEDCDGFAMYAGCLLMALGIPVALVTVAADPEVPERYSHVYLAAYPKGPNGPRVALDFSHGKHIGWECPNLGRIREWPVWVTPTEILFSCVAPVVVAAGAFFGLRYLQSRRVA